MARVLVVEDELLIADDLTHKLHHLGHTVVGQAITAESAVQKVSDVQPDLVLMDIRLRGKMSGLEAARRIQDVHPIPIVFVTAHASAIETHPSFVITKPFTLDQIESVIKRACGAT